jgi:hypothetical protein
MPIPAYRIRIMLSRFREACFGRPQNLPSDHLHLPPNFYVFKCVPTPVLISFSRLTKRENIKHISVARFQCTSALA